MTEIPEHLLKRAKEAREKTPASEPEATAAPEPEAASDSRIPAHLLQRSKAAKSAKADGDADLDPEFLLGDDDRCS